VHSYQLTIKSPATHKTRTFTAALPADLQNTLNGLRALRDNGAAIREAAG
jgi:hypothetical protein